MGTTCQWYDEGSRRNAAEDPCGRETLAAHLQGRSRRLGVAKEALTGVAAGTGGPELRFLVDENAARIVRWLRLMGYDTSYLPGIADGTLLSRAR